MSAAIALREDFKAEDLRALARESRDTRQCRRLLALAAVGEGRSRAEVAAIGGMDRQTLRDWVHRFNAEGPEGLLDRQTDGPPPKLTSEQEAELAAIVEADPDRQETGLVRWRRVDLKVPIRSGPR
jgi:transposase